MTTSELRIGNWVMYKDKVRKIDGLWGDNFILPYHSFWSSEEILNPILLTPEILECAGFTKSEKSNEFWEFWTLPNNWYISKSLHTEPSAGVKEGCVYWGEEYWEIKSLHHLQNIYHALTGQELKIEL